MGPPICLGPYAPAYPDAVGVIFFCQPFFRQYFRLILLLMFERYGQRFAFWTDEARSLLQGTLQPIFRVPREARHHRGNYSPHSGCLWSHCKREKRLVDFIVQSSGAEQHLVALRHIHHYRLRVNKSTRAFVKNIVNYVAHLLAVKRQ